MEFDLTKRINYYFNELAMIPRASRNEKAASDYIVAFAKAHGLPWKQDHVWNVLVDKPASPGYESAEPVILQAHLDMVCEKTADTDHNFDTDPLSLYVDEKGWLRAKGTTLGCDDGYGVAYMLAILEDDTLAHPPLECMFTTMEEIGLLGARELKEEDLHGKRLINLDGGGEVITTVSCAGGATMVVRKDLVYTANTDPGYLLGIRGLTGGHSGGNIHLEKGNAITLAARVLYELKKSGIDLTIADYNGGQKFNAIPREATVIFTSPDDPAKIKACVDQMEACIKEELEFSDGGFFIEFKGAGTPDKKLDKVMSDRIIDYFFLVPDGFQHRSMVIDGLTTASLNMGTFLIEDGKLECRNLIRTAIASQTDELFDKAQRLGEICGLDVVLEDRFPGWNYSKVSPLREKLKEVLAARGTEITEEATHGGLEVSFFKGLVPDLDIITYGPVAYGAHTPEERLDLASFARAYDNLCALLAALTE